MASVMPRLSRRRPLAAAVLSRTPIVNLQRLRLPFYIYVYSDETASFQHGSKFHSLLFDSRSLTIDGVRIVRPEFGPRSVSWRQQVGDLFTAGHLEFLNNGLECQGTISAGKDAQSSQIFSVFATAIPPSLYQTQITLQRYPEGTDPASIPADGWQQGLELSLSYDYQPGQPLPTSKVTLAGNDVSAFVGISIVGDDLLRLTLAASSVCSFAPELYAEADLTFTTFGEAFSGSVSGTCQDQNGQGVYLWKGSTPNAVALEGKMSLGRGVMRSAGIAARGDIRPRAKTTTSAPGLSLAELMSLVPDESVSKMAQDMLAENMKWAMAQDATETTWLQDFFLQNSPALPPKRIGLIQQDLAWYQKDFSVAYLAYGLNQVTGAGAPETPLTDDQLAKLEYYLKQGMGKSPEYTRQYTGIFQGAYLQAKPRLAYYIQDTNASWATRMYEAMTLPQQLDMMVNRIIGTVDMSGANNIAALLQILDPTGALAKQYQMTILSRVLLHFSLQTVVQDEDATMEWLPAALEAFVQQYENAQEAGSGALEKQIAEGLKRGVETFRSFNDLAKVMAGFLITATGATIAEQGESAREAFTEAYPELSDAANVFFFISWVGGLFGIILAYLGWDDMPTTQKIKVINSSVLLVGDAADAVINILKGQKFTLNDEVAISRWSSGADALKDAGDMIEMTEVKDFVRAGTESTGDLFNAESRAVEAQGTQWEKIFAVPEKVIKVVGVVTSAVFSVLSAIDFADDVKNHRPVSQQALDGIMMVANSFGTIALVLDLALDAVIYSLAASVFAIIGLIVTIISLFMPAPAEPSPVDAFMNDVAVPFVDGLPQPA